MRCFVTAGPTWEPLDRVRRLTNFSTGSLGGQLANHLAAAGHEVRLFLGGSAVWRGSLAAVTVEEFSTTASLGDRIAAHAGPEPIAFFHAAAVSDFTGGTALERSSDGTLSPLSAGKLSTRGGTLLIELVPTPKILPRLRALFPAGWIVGWKFEADGDRADVLARVARQFAESRNDLCVANGPAYGDGFGLVAPAGEVTHHTDRPALFAALTERLREMEAGRTGEQTKVLAVPPAG